MEDLPRPDRPRAGAVDEVPFQHRPNPPLRESADADRPGRRERAERSGELTIASRVNLAQQRRWELVRGEVPAGCLEKRKRAIVQHEPVGEERLGRAEAQRGPAPQPAAAHLGALAFEALDRPARMLAPRPIHARSNAHPVAHRGDLAERHAGLHHPERPRIHPEQHHSLAAGAEAPHVRLIGRPRVLVRIVNVRDRRRERELCQGARQLARRVEEDACTHRRRRAVSRADAACPSSRGRRRPPAEAARAGPGSSGSRP